MAWALACALPTRPSFGVLSFLVKNPRAVSEATTKGVDARESDDACRILRNFSEEKKFFQIFPPIKTFGELGIDP